MLSSELYAGRHKKEMRVVQRGRPRRFDRTEALDRALMAFWQNGFEATSMDDLIGAMGINSPSIYAAFGSKQNLFSEAVGHYSTRYAGGLMDALNAAPDAASGLSAMFVAAIELFTCPKHPHGCFIVTAMGGNAPVATEVRNELERLRRERSDEIAARLQRDVIEGRLSPDLPVQPLADMYTAILQGISVAARDNVPKSRLASLYSQSLGLLM
jgi:AcrR family transcriptional regulator